MNNYIDYDSQSEDVDTFNSTPPLFFNGSFLVVFNYVNYLNKYSSR